jgi:hypothetical protein
MRGLFIEKCSYEIFGSTSKDVVLHYGFYVIKSHDLKGRFCSPHISNKLAMGGNKNNCNGIRINVIEHAFMVG